jgi:hypothetical protein
VPLYHERVLTAVSACVGNYEFHPYWIVLINWLWVRSPTISGSSVRAERLTCTPWRFQQRATRGWRAYLRAERAKVWSAETQD